jgi:phage-related protein
MNKEREKAMIYILSFFRSKMAAMNKHNVSQVKEYISTHEIAVSELVDMYVRLVYENS